MNDDAITFINKEEQEEPIKKIKEVPVKIDNEFINGLPDWDLEPPFELIKRSNL